MPAPARRALLSVALGLAPGTGFVALPAAAQSTANTVGIDIPYETFTLPNGLRVVVHTDE